MIEVNTQSQMVDAIASRNVLENILALKIIHNNKCGTLEMIDRDITCEV